jgi:flavin-dependent dehydrogenase
MPKAKLIFMLPDDQQEFDVASKGRELYLSLWELDSWLREQAKYQGKLTIDVDAVRDQMREIMDAHNVHLGMMD